MELAIEMYDISRSRRSDPVTSKTAAARVPSFAGGHYARILSALERITNATAKEIADQAGLTVEQVCRRLPELERAGKVRFLPDTMGDVPIVRAGFRVWSLIR